MNARLIAVLVAAAASLAAGLSTGLGLYYLFGAVLLLLVALSLISVIWTLLTVRITLTGVKTSVVRGDAMIGVFTVRHFSLLPVASIRIEISVPSRTSNRQEIRITTPPFASRTFRHRIECPHRGTYEAGIRRIVARDVFGLFRFGKKSHQAPVVLEVHPKQNSGAILNLDAADVGPEYKSMTQEDASSPSFVRPWRDGDSLKKVHWKLSMRRREIVVRTFEESARPDTLIIPDLSAITAMTDERLTLEDLICESALSSAKAQLDAGFPVRMPLTSAKPLQVNGQRPSDVQAFADALLNVEFDSPYPYEKVLIQMMGRLQRTGGAVLVTAKLTLHVADAVVRMRQSGIRTRLIWITDDPRPESLMLLARMKMAKVEVERIDPWQRDKVEDETQDEADMFL